MFVSFSLNVLFWFQNPIQDTVDHMVVLSPQAPFGCDFFFFFPLKSMTLTKGAALALSPGRGALCILAIASRLPPKPDFPSARWNQPLPPP